MSTLEERQQINKTVDQIGQIANVNFRASPMSSRDIVNLIEKKFKYIVHKSEGIAQFCLKDIAKYYDKGVVIFIDGCLPGKHSFDGVDYRELFGIRMSYLLCAKVSHSQFLTDDSVGSVFTRVEFDDFVDSIFNFEEFGQIYSKLVSDQILMLSNVNNRTFEKMVKKTIPAKDGQDPSEVLFQELPERIAKISSAIDRLIDSRIRLNRPTIITVFDDFDNVFIGKDGKDNTVGKCMGNTLNRISSLVTEPKDVNDFSEEICLRGCCRLCLAYTKEYLKFGSDSFSKDDFLKSLKKHEVTGDFTTFFSSLESSCKEIGNIRSEDVFWGLKNDFEVVVEKSPKAGQNFFDSISLYPKMWCVLKGIQNG